MRNFIVLLVVIVMVLFFILKGGDDTASFEVPNGYTNTGLAYDPVLDILWSSDYTNRRIYKLEKDGYSLGYIQMPTLYDMQGVTYDSSDDTLWALMTSFPDVKAVIYHLQKDGNIIDTFEVNYIGSSGICYLPSDDTLLISEYATNKIRKYNATTYAYISEFTVPSMTTPATTGGIDGIAYDASDGTLWVTENMNPIRHINMDGLLIANVTNPAPEQQSEGIAVDASDNTLWFSADDEFHKSLADGNRIFHINKDGTSAAIPIESITLTPFTIAINPGAVVQLAALDKYGGGMTELQWEVSSSIATVNNGQLTAINPGVVYVRASKEGVASNRCWVVIMSIDSTHTNMLELGLVTDKEKILIPLFNSSSGSSDVASKLRIGLADGIIRCFKLLDSPNANCPVLKYATAEGVKVVKSYE